MIDKTDARRVKGSFRDPSGFVFNKGGIVYRQVNPSYREHYDHLIDSGLYADLSEGGLLVPHEEAGELAQSGADAYKIIKPRRIPFISYPYEWCFSQLQDAALLTLDLLKRALAHDMTLKDASAYNVQFLHGKPILIDTLSFELYEAGRPWQAYRQFCQHFLAPLALMSYKDARLSQSLRAHIDGIPLDLAATLLPKRAYLNLGLIMHLFLHARAQRRYAGKAIRNDSRRTLGKQALLNIADNLHATIAGLRWEAGKTDWADYYLGDSYHEAGFESKQRIVSRFIDRAHPKRLWDMGANTGLFSRIASQRGIFTISIDSDPGVVEANYRQAKREGDQQLHPLVIDLSNPSPAIGWANSERESLMERCQADCVLALALVHHLAIGNNLPLHDIARYFAMLAKWLIIEFVPKTDGKARQLLATRRDIFVDYTREGFERAFGEVYDVLDQAQVEESDRRIYLLARR